MWYNMKMNKTHYHSERGSAFVFILIGVVLFAALSYAVTQSIRVSTDSTGPSLGAAERNTTTVTDLMQFLDSLKMRIFEMSSAGISESKFDFRNNVYLLATGATITANNNASCGGATDCSVFSPYAPNGITPILFTNAADTSEQTTNTIPKNGHGRVGEINIKGVGTVAPDLVFIIQGIKPDICNLYNAKQGLTTNYTAATDLTSIGESATSVPAAFSGYTTSNSFAYGATTFTGKKSFCAPAIDGADHKLAIWHVLKVR